MIDLHTHSRCSDGQLDPQQLVDLAAREGVRMLSITDHDTLAAHRIPLDIPGQMQLIPGVELSATWRGTSIHVVGLGVDPDSAAMISAEQTQADLREQRFERICQALRDRGLSIDSRQVRARAEGTPGRPHIAGYLVDTGQAASINRAFRKYLGNKRLPFAQKCWPPLAQCVDWILQAGGVAVLAHPLKYDLTRSKLNTLVEEFQTAGGEAIEVVSGPQSDADTWQLRDLAKRFNLFPSVGSDHHGPRDGCACLGIAAERIAGIENLLSRF